MASISASATPGSGQPPGAAGASNDEFARCMTEHGAAPQEMEMNGDRGSAQQSPPSEADQAKRRAALEACRRYLPDGGNPQPMRPEQLEQARAIAKCMREAGVAYPDPDPNAAGGDGAMQIPPGVDFADPEVQRKLQECSRAAGVGGGPGATAPGR